MPLILVSGIAAAIFVVLLPIAHPYPLSWLLKMVPLLCLSAYAFIGTSGRERILVLAALGFCMTGDVLLDLDRSANFKPALAVFLLGHILYFSVFALRGLTFARSRRLAAAAVLAFGSGVGIALSSIDPGFLLPVYAYLVAITAMTLAAFAIKSFSPLIAVGAALFMISDTVIAINKFLSPIPYSTMVNISLYFAAQILIIAGIARRGEASRSAE
jgi:uncharacterized membrane protein YhhN